MIQGCCASESQRSLHMWHHSSRRACRPLSSPADGKAPRAGLPVPSTPPPAALRLRPDSCPGLPSTLRRWTRRMRSPWRSPTSSTSPMPTATSAPQRSRSGWQRRWGTAGGRAGGCGSPPAGCAPAGRRVQAPGPRSAGSCCRAPGGHRVSDQAAAAAPPAVQGWAGTGWHPAAHCCSSRGCRPAPHACAGPACSAFVRPASPPMHSVARP